MEMFSGSNIFGPLLVHLMPAIERIDRYLLAIERLQELGGGDDEVDPVDPEEASLWLLNPHRLTKLYQLRCLANLESCHQTRQVQNWMQFPTALAADNHQQVVAICHHLFARAGPKEVELLSGLLLESEAPREGNSSSQEGQFTSGGIKLSATIQQLVTGCVQDEVLVERVVQQILRTRNAVVYSAALNVTQ